jgi:hypothetical protein
MSAGGKHVWYNRYREVESMTNDQDEQTQLDRIELQLNYLIGQFKKYEHLLNMFNAPKSIFSRKR